ncbi:hypothetical protein C7974DRAFT_472063 [Boeremia exigua]|uniref:uncharacterized protein n=1 Tax=Boeremia exigua TaxID=749465 RepID=UPI001E8DA4F4|nr:uncharacterized protein C7974DRAFT_472063 [Boeremia exigua]KAH6629211.1 hypothetical protein C7974DRAFT_472063 [Boeremia exigua]
MGTPAPSTERDRACVKLVHTFKSQAIAKAKVDATETKLKALRRERKKLQQVAADADTSAEQAFQDYANTVCRELCDAVYNSLPREVRDMIYGYLYEEQSWDVTDAYFDLDAVPTKYCAPAHMWKPSAAGEALHRELCEHFFRSNKYCFYKASFMPEFRAIDRWGIGYTPAVLPTDIRIDFRYGDYDLNKKDNKRVESKDREGNHGWGSNGWGSNAWDTTDSTRKTRSELLSELEMLFGFCAGTRLTIRVVPLSSGWDYASIEVRERAFNDFFPLVLPVLDRLRASGCRSRIVIVYSLDCSWIEALPDFVYEGELSLELCRTEYEKYEAGVRKKREDTELDAATDSDADSDYTDTESI